MSIPRLSVVIPTRNRPQRLARCVRSLADQDAPPGSHEIIVVDDGSTCRTAISIAREAGDVAFRQIDQPWGGISSARNAGIRAASGSLISFVADDYVLPSQYVSHALSFFERTPEAAAVRFRIAAADHDYLSRVAHFYFDLNLRNNIGPRPEPSSLSIGRGFRKLVGRLPPHGNEPTTQHCLSASGAAVFRASVFDRVGFFDPSLVRAEDSDFAQRMRRLQVPLFYDPTLVIERSYETRLAAALVAEGRNGLHLARLEARMSEGSVLRQLARAALNLAARPLWRARQAESLRQAVEFLPLLTGLELVHFVGFVVGSFRQNAGSRVGHGAASTLGRDAPGVDGGRTNDR